MKILDFLHTYWAILSALVIVCIPYLKDKFKKVIATDCDIQKAFNEEVVKSLKTEAGNLHIREQVSIVIKEPFERTHKRIDSIESDIKPLKELMYEIREQLKTMLETNKINFENIKEDIKELKDAKK